MPYPLPHFGETQSPTWPQLLKLTRFLHALPTSRITLMLNHRTGYHWLAMSILLGTLLSACGLTDTSVTAASGTSADAQEATEALRAETLARQRLKAAQDAAAVRNEQVETPEKPAP